MGTIYGIFLIMGNAGFISSTVRPPRSPERGGCRRPLRDRQETLETTRRDHRISNWPNCFPPMLGGVQEQNGSAKVLDS